MPLLYKSVTSSCESFPGYVIALCICLVDKVLCGEINDLEWKVIHIS